MFDSTRTLWYAFTHLYHLDKSNAALHCSDVRFSPITFRLAEALAEQCGLSSLGALNESQVNEVEEVLMHKGLYEEDKGR